MISLFKACFLCLTIFTWLILIHFIVRVFHGKDTLFLLRPLKTWDENTHHFFPNSYNYGTMLYNSTVGGSLATSEKRILIIYWSKTFGIKIPVNVNPNAWPFFYSDESCPIKCELTNDKRRVGEATALVVYSRNVKEEMPPASLKNLTWIIHSNENPVFTWALRTPHIMAQFNYSITYRLDSDFPCPEFRKPQLDLPLPFEERGLVMVAISHCEVIRTAYVKKLMEFIPVDSYGKCLKNKEGLKRQFTEVYEHAHRAVREIQRNYKFSLIFPNADCDYYMTEKLHNAMSAGSVPVWMGTDKIDEVLQWGNLKHSIIKVKHFATPQKLAEYLLYLSKNETEYNKYLKWKYEGFQFPKEYYESPIGLWWDGLPLYCRVCMKLAKDPHGHSGLPVDRCAGKESRTSKKWLW